MEIKEETKPIYGVVGHQKINVYYVGKQRFESKKEAEEYEKKRIEVERRDTILRSIEEIHIPFESDGTRLYVVDTDEKIEVFVDRFFSNPKCVDMYFNNKKLDTLDIPALINIFKTSPCKLWTHQYQDGGDYRDEIYIENFRLYKDDVIEFIQKLHKHGIRIDLGGEIVCLHQK